MKNRKGFTLIELLAIIVILAIIAVITVPIILGIIDDAKKGTAKDSAYGYKDAVNKYNMYLQAVDSTSLGLKGGYTVSELKTAGLQVSGQEPSQGIVILDNEGLSGCLQFDDYASYLYNDDVINTFKGDCPAISSGAGLYKSQVSPGTLIYKGSDPNNRIYLKEDGTNEVLYRVFSFESDGTIKVVRQNTVTSAPGWDQSSARKNDGTNNTYCSTASCNVWGNQYNTLYNGSPLGENFHYSYYESSSATTFTSGPSGTVGNVSGNDAKLNEYLNGTWLTSYLSNYIVDHEFNVGGVYYSNTYSGGDKGLIKEVQEEASLKWIGKIGLLSATEHVQSSANPNCTSLYSSYYYALNENGDLLRENLPNGEWPCGIENYNVVSYGHLTMSPCTSKLFQIWEIYQSGSFYPVDAGASSHSAHAIRPAFYLKAGTKLTGDGSSDNPFRIVGM